MIIFADKNLKVSTSIDINTGRVVYHFDVSEPEADESIRTDLNLMDMAKLTMAITNSFSRNNKEDMDKLERAAISFVKAIGKIKEKMT